MSTGDALSPQLVSLQRFQMEANFEGLIQLLAKNLYPEPDVFVRELIQNSHDSAVLRQKDEPGFIPEIDVSFDIEKRTVTFSDNARGMNLDEIRGFLAGEPVAVDGPFGVAFEPLSGRWRQSHDADVNYMLTVTRDGVWEAPAKPKRKRSPRPSAKSSS